MHNHTILSIRRDAKKLVKKYQMDFEDYLLKVSLNTADDDTSDVFIHIEYYDEQGKTVASSVGNIFPNRALLDFETSISIAAVKLNSPHGLTL